MAMHADYLVDRELNYEAVIFADASGDGLSVQRLLEPGQQDIALGQDGYCVCLTTGQVVYGGVTDWSATEDTVTLRLSDHAAAELGIASDLSLALEPQELTAVRPHLTRLLGNS
jgi:hypothetical protein